MSREKKRVVIAVPPELVELSEEDKARLQSAFRLALVDSVGVRGNEFGDDDDLSPVIQNTRDISELSSEIARPAASASGSKKGAGTKKAASKKGAKKGASKKGSRGPSPK